MKKRLMILIPAYNEGKNISKVVEELQGICPKINYLIINDGSTDDTLKVCRNNGYDSVLNLPVNLGLGGAFQAGVRYAYEHDYDYVIQFDGDGQHRAEYIEKMLEYAVDKKADIVIGSRFLNKKKAFSPRMIGSRVISFLIYITTGRRIKDPTSGMRLFSRRVMQRMAYGVNMQPEPDTVAFMIKCGAVVDEYQVEMDERIEGESYLNFSNSVKYMYRVIFSILLIQSIRERKLL